MEGSCVMAEGTDAGIYESAGTLGPRVLYAEFHLLRLELVDDGPTRSRRDLARRSSLQTARVSPRLKCRHEATVHAEHIHHRRRRRRRFDISRCQVCARSMIAGGMRAGNGRYFFDNPVKRDYNVSDFAK